MKNFFSVLRGIQSDVKFITLYNYVRVVLCHPSLPFYRLMQIYQNGISQGKKKGKYSNTTKSREKKPTKIKAEHTAFEKDILISLEHLVVFSV
jgi:hypothetical protein